MLRFPVKNPLGPPCSRDSDGCSAQRESKGYLRLFCRVFSRLCEAVSYYCVSRPLSSSLQGGSHIAARRPPLKESLALCTALTRSVSLCSVCLHLHNIARWKDGSVTENIVDRFTALSSYHWLFVLLKYM